MAGQGNTQACPSPPAIAARQTLACLLTESLMIRSLLATRYLTPLREGGSLPAIVEADDDELYVMKFAGAGQGPKALIAELVAGEIGRALGLPVPEIVLMTLDISSAAPRVIRKSRRCYRPAWASIWGYAICPKPLPSARCSGRRPIPAWPPPLYGSMPM